MAATDLEPAERTAIAGALARIPAACRRAPGSRPRSSGSAA